ncbi:MAG: hypothetical protein K8R23_09570 [Chthoniobacter sp.]|nr:hypothetical protein [Chthoniobacter sp.]
MMKINFWRGNGGRIVIVLKASTYAEPTSGAPIGANQMVNPLPDNWDPHNGTVLVPQGKMLTRDGQVISVEVVP